MNTQTASRELLSKDQAAEYANISPRTIDRMIRSGALRAGRAGSRIVIRRTDLESAIFGDGGAATIKSK